MGGARAEGIGVPTGARATIFVTGDEQQENANQKEEQQTSKKKCKQRQTKRKQKHTSDELSNIRKQAKTAEQKETETHGTS